MAKMYLNRLFDGLTDRNSGRVFSDIELNRCSFIGCVFSITRNPERRTKVRNVKLLNCEAQGCSVKPAIIEDTVIDGLKTHQLLQTWGAVFRHVILRGKIGRIMISPLIDLGMAPARVQQSFDLANAEFYAQTDWALDIREAAFMECDLRGIPAHLVRRDPSTQFVVKRETLLQREWRQIDLLGTYLPTALEFLLEQDSPDMVLVAPKLSPIFPRLMEALERLREAGIAEPD